MISRPSLAAATRLYLRREAQAHYHWRFGLLVGAAVAIPLVVGELTEARQAALIGALAAWFMALAIPPRTVLERAVTLGQRLLLLTATSALGLLTAHHLLWTALVIVVLALMIPVPGMTITPLIIFIMATSAPHGITAPAYLQAFFLSGTAATALLLIPAAASPVAPPVTGLTCPHPYRRLAAHIRSRSPQARYALQAAVCICVGYVTLTALHWPHASWVLVGVLTTLRPSWDATEARLVKRSIGMVGGSALTPLLLLICAHTGYWITLTLIAVLAGLARPLRQYNYGYWPILGTPVLMLLGSLATPLTTTDAAWRLGNNLLGAAITLLAVTLLWPHADQRRRHRPDSSVSTDVGPCGRSTVDLRAGSDRGRQL
ncbi:FUSC family protein [Streptomyces vinaceus]